MFKYKVQDIVQAVDGQLIKGNKNQILKGVSTDTRNLIDEDIFIALIGEHFDAHNFIDNSLVKRVKAIVVQRDLDVECENIIKVKDTTKALQSMAKFHRDQFEDVKVIGITGSSGKTSTKDILFNLLNGPYQVKKNEGNLNNHIGVPLTLFRLTGNEDFFIVEMGMSHKGEISLLADISNPQIGLITNVGRAHIKFFNSVEDIAKAKGELVEALEAGDLAVLNYDNKYTSILNNLAGENIRRQYFGFDKNADYHILDFEYTNQGMEFTLATKNTKIKFTTNLFGEHNLYNIASAVTIAREVGLEWEQIKEALQNITLSGLRSEIKEKEGIIFINDCYNANPLSMKNAIKMLKNIKGNNKIAVLGDMLELGDIKNSAHLEIGEFIAEYKVDFLLTTGKLGKFIAEGARQNGMDNEKIFHFKDKTKISDKIREISREDDVILLKGSRGMKMEVIYQDFNQNKEG